VERACAAQNLLKSSTTKASHLTANTTNVAHDSHIYIWLPLPLPLLLLLAHLLASACDVSLSVSQLSPAAAAQKQASTPVLCAV
jgi:hypothetical protein